MILGCPTMATEKKERLVSFLERPDISYCKPGQGDTVYCGREESGEKIYKSKHYLLWPIREGVVMFNEENSDAINYKQIQQVISTEKHILKVGEKNKDDCRCEKCENTELLLAAIKRYTKLDTSVDSHEFISKIVCSMKSYECLNEECEKCEKSEIMNNVMESLE